MARMDVDRLNEAKEWLRARLEGRSPTYREVMDDAVCAGFKPSEIEFAKGSLGVRSKKVGFSGPQHWTLPPPPAVYNIPAAVMGDEEKKEALKQQRLENLRKARDKRHPPKATPPEPPAPPPPPAPASLGPGPSSGPVPGLTRGDDPKLTKLRTTVEDRVRTASNLIKRRAPTAARYLRDLADTASQDAPKCPACGRGTPRGEELRLKAILALLDRAGVVAPRGGPEDTERGPLIVFPPGTSIAVVAKPLELPAVDLVARRVEPEVRLTRGDRLGQGFAGAAAEAARDAAEDGGSDA